MALVLDNAPIPATDAIARPKRPQYGNKQDPLEGQITTPWLEYMTRLSTVVSQGPSKIATVSLTTQAASIAGTDIAQAALTAGLYRVTYYWRITQAAAVSSSLQIAFAWTDGGVAQTATGAALTTNMTTTYQTNFVMVRIDSASSIQYATTYASSGSPAMQYSLDVILERL